MQQRPLGRSGLAVSRLALGTMTWGRDTDQDEAAAQLKLFLEAGGTLLDTADVYGDGDAEAVIGSLLEHVAGRNDMLIATKAGLTPNGHRRRDGSRGNLLRSLDRSLRRLGTDHVDLWQVHGYDPDTPLEETLEAFDALVRAGKVRYLGASNYSAERLAEALSISDRNGLARYAVLQPHYNLVERDYERDLAPLVAREGLATLPYFSLAKGFLTGKYRTKDETGDSPRAARAASYLDRRGEHVLSALDEVAQAHGVSVATVSLAWLRAQPTVAAPIASARTPEQLTDLIASVSLDLTEAEVTALGDAAS
jgi:aryl-alcohol dehydrogenase-like predicted oxidoreductase